MPKMNFFFFKTFHILKLELATMTFDNLYIFIGGCMKHYWHLILSLLLIVVLAACSDDDDSNPTKNDDDKDKDPAIDSLVPAAAKIGDEIAIHGNYFGEGGDELSYAQFGSVRPEESDYLEWTNTKIRVFVPDGAKSGNIVVYNQGKGSLGKPFAVIDTNNENQNPFIESVIPDTVEEGGYVTIKGYFFGDERGENYVQIGSRMISDYNFWSDKKIIFQVPEGYESGFVMVRVDDKASNTLYLAINREPRIPSITSLSENVLREGDEIRIEGENFGYPQENGKVYFGGVEAAQYVKWRDDYIDVVVPDGISDGYVKVVAADGESEGYPYTVFVDTGEPYIEDLDLNIATAGEILAITGRNFGDSQNGSYVTFGGAQATEYVSWSDIKIRVVIPDEAQTGDVIVHVGAEQSNGVPFTVQSKVSLVETVLVPKGSFKMGRENDDWDAFQHDITITYDFYMSKYEIDQETFKKVYDNFNPSKWANDKMPVEQLSWFHAVEFCNRLSKMEGYDTCYTINGEQASCNFSKNGYRLPTEAEWEYACRAGSEGSVYGILDEISWYADNAGNAYHEPGGKQPNAFGLYDMLGNVAEWCWDWYDASYYENSPATDPTGPAKDASISEKVYRGGSYMRSSDKVKAWYRTATSPQSRFWYVGMRVVRRK